MAFFEDVLSTVFGGVDTSAQDAQAAANRLAQQRIDISTQQARQDILGAFPRADVSRNLGFQGALDILGQSIPQQLQAFQAGNVGAQGQISAGLPQFQAAILGQPTDFSAFQPSTIGFDPSFAQQTLPFGQPAQQAQQNQQVQALINALGGGQAAGQGGAGVPLSSGDRERGQVTGSRAGGDLDLSNLSAQDLDTLQRFGGALNLGGPIGSFANLALGELARRRANLAFPTQEPIGFIEDILNPDIFGGSPLDIQQAREVASRPAAQAAARQAGLARDVTVRQTVERAQREGRTAGGAAGRASARERGLGGRAR